MLYNYSPLWHFLKERRMTKGQLALSSATVARMTAGEPVNLDVIGHLCDLLQCRIEDILSIEPDVTSMRWQNIRPSDTFSLNAYFSFKRIPISPQFISMAMQLQLPPVMIRKRSIGIWIS